MYSQPSPSSNEESQSLCNGSQFPEEQKGRTEHFLNEFANLNMNAHQTYNKKIKYIIESSEFHKNLRQTKEKFRKSGQSKLTKDEMKELQDFLEEHSKILDDIKFTYSISRFEIIDELKRELINSRQIENGILQQKT